MSDILDSKEFNDLIFRLPRQDKYDLISFIRKNTLSKDYEKSLKDNWIQITDDYRRQITVLKEKLKCQQ